MDNQCRDCEKPIPSYEERCAQCWRELDHEFERDPLEAERSLKDG